MFVLVLMMTIQKIEQIERQQLQNKFSLANFDDDFIKKLSCC
jgi:hypothetical protein